MLTSHCLVETLMANIFLVAHIAFNWKCITIFLYDLCGLLFSLLYSFLVAKHCGVSKTQR